MGHLLDIARLACEEDAAPPRPSMAATQGPGAPVGPDLGTEARRQRVLAMLADRPHIRYQIVVDDPDSDPVRLMVGIRGVATFELEIPKAKYDPALLLDLIRRHGERPH